MRVLLAHNRYGRAAPSGENVAWEVDRQLLRSAGHEVLELTRESDGLRRAGWRGAGRAALAVSWNPFAAREVARVVAGGGVEIFHLHNFFPSLSPAVLRAARRAGAATVFTLHNCRIFCAAGIALREGQPCTECLKRRVVSPSLRHGCYRGSRLATLPLAAMISLHRSLGTWERHVDAFIVFTEFQRALMTGAGLPAGKVHVVPPCYPDAPSPVPWRERDERAIFVGRLGEEKGVDVLLRAWAAWGAEAPRLEIVGEGPEGEALRRLAGEVGVLGRVAFSGLQPFEETQRRLGRARLLLQPSRCFENFPMTLREALALGVPLAGSRRGALPWIIREGSDGILFEAGDERDLHARVSALWSDTARLAAMARAARARFEGDLGGEKGTRRLVAVYAAARETRRGRGVARA